MEFLEIFHHMKVQKAEYESTFGVRAAVKSLQLGIVKENKERDWIKAYTSSSTVSAQE